MRDASEDVFQETPHPSAEGNASLSTNTTMQEMVLMIRNVTFWIGSSLASEIDK